MNKCTLIDSRVNSQKHALSPLAFLLCPHSPSMDEEEDDDLEDSYVEIPTIDSDQAYRFMVDFVDEIQDTAMRDRLRAALSGQKPFRRFQETVANDRRLQRQWNIYESDREHQVMIAWLHSIGIEPENGPVVTLPELPDLRKIMLDEVKRFVESASQISGVEQIALSWPTSSPA